MDTAKASEETNFDRAWHCVEQLSELAKGYLDNGIDDMDPMQARGFETLIDQLTDSVKSSPDWHVISPKKKESLFLYICRVGPAPLVSVVFEADPYFHTHGSDYLYACYGAFFQHTNNMDEYVPEELQQTLHNLNRACLLAKRFEKGKGKFQLLANT